jgi:hypothetical protein
VNKHNHDKLKLEQHKHDKYLKKCWYNGIQFSSIFEVEVAQYLDQLKIKWEKNEKAFPATMEDGRILHYYPDIYLPDFNAYCEVKGIWFSKEKRIKTYLAVEQNNLNWTHILLKEWKQSKHILRSRLDNLRKKQQQENNIN